jgi:DNA invertase Pin-like site-specific DNA recombinase
MHRIEQTQYGYKLVFEGFLQKQDLSTLLDDMKQTIRSRGRKFPVLLDMRHSRAFPADAQEILKEAIRFFKQVGMERNAVVLNSAIATLQTKRLLKETGIDATSRYFDASTEQDWEKVALAWLVGAVDPDAH